ncbi:hypothetical protein ORIO_08560 [Cereibacter azotoformans]|nr:hypothetical protein [Cereibacter azotoformans]ULB09957.1 hypothetical protein ORIO_08560 [Cereibacter azotoformans]
MEVRYAPIEEVLGYGGPEVTARRLVKRLRDDLALAKERGISAQTRAAIQAAINAAQNDLYRARARR